MADAELEKQIQPKGRAVENPTDFLPSTEKDADAENKEAEPSLTKKTGEADTKTRGKFHLPQTRKTLPIPTMKDEVMIKVEKIMEDGLNEAFQCLSPVARQEFKIKGEKTAAKISELLRATHVKIKKIFRLLVEWLRMLPGINRFFLEQEAKIKTDRILEIKKRQS